jgi:protein-L-isoaspartate O-methyltransferase
LGSDGWRSFSRLLFGGRRNKLFHAKIAKGRRVAKALHKAARSAFLKREFGAFYYSDKALRAAVPFA